MLTIFGGFLVFLKTLGFQPYIHKELDSCFSFLLIGIVDNALFSFLDLIPVCSKDNIVNHMSVKHKLA
jgi:hypothetical protein